MNWCLLWKISGVVLTAWEPGDRPSWVKYQSYLSCWEKKIQTNLPFIVHGFLKSQTTSSWLESCIGVWPSAWWWPVQTRQHSSMQLRPAAEKKTSLCAQKQLRGTRQCASCAMFKSIQAMTNLDLLRQGCFLFRVFLEAGENAGSRQEVGLAYLSLIFIFTLNMLYCEWNKNTAFSPKKGRRKGYVFWDSPSADTS